MTELENHLLNALRDLSKQFKEQHANSEGTLKVLQAMYERTLEENAILSEQVESLMAQITLLSRQMNQFADLYDQNN